MPDQLDEGLLKRFVQGDRDAFEGLFSSFGAWMRRIATNTARDHLKRAKSFAGWTTAHDETPAPPPADGDIGESVRRALCTLPPRLQVVATLALVEELPYTEIAEALDVPVGTVKSRVFRATRALRKEL